MPNPIGRMLDEFPDVWPIALVKLIDALDNFIRADQQGLEDFLDEGGKLTPAELDKWRAQIGVCRVLLDELRALEPGTGLVGIDP